MNASSHIAIVGIGGIFPGSTDLEQFWSHVLAGRSVARDVPPDRWPLPADAVYAPRLAADKVYSRRACFVENFQFDPAGLALDAAWLQRLDPMFHLLLHAGRMAWRDAVTQRVDRQRAGVIIGNIALPTDAASALTEELLGPLFASQALGRQETSDRRRQGVEPMNRYVAGLPAGLLAQALGLGGGSFTLDAACASSLYALKLAADELIAGRADIMLAGGVSRPDCLYTQMGFSQLHALSPSGCCAPFDVKADGLVVGEGAGIVVLKRLDDALRDGDHVYATIAGIGLSNDIAGTLMQPDSGGQLRAMRAAYIQAGWHPEMVDLIECHGTGTPVGDGVELNSLRQLWTAGTPGRCVLGSVKSNIGHLLTAAGAAGLIKVLLAMRAKMLPPMANFETPAPALDRSPFTVLRRAREWTVPDGTPCRAAISGFGFGGINAHVLLEEWSKPRAVSVSAPGPVTPPAVAIVGMGAHFGPWQSLAAFRRRVLQGDHVAAQSPRRWWGLPQASQFKGYFLEDLSVPVGRFRIPPAELAEMLPQQLLMLQVAADAFEDAGWNPSVDERLDIGVFVGVGLDLNTTNFRFRWLLQSKARRWAEQLDLNLTDEQLEQWIRELRDAAGPPLNANRTMGALGGIVASRIARAFRIGGPSFTISSEESSSLRALELGLRALQRGELNAALVGGVDLAGDVRAVWGQEAARPYTRSGVCRPLDVAADGPLVGEGAAALLLKRYDDALRDDDRIYAVIRGIGVAGGPVANHITPSADAYKRAVEAAHAEAGVRRGEIEYLETHGSGCAQEDAVEADALSQIIGGRQAQGAICSLGSVKADIGHAGAAAGVASLVKTALCLHEQKVPALRQVERLRPALSEAAVETPSTARYWLHDRAAGPRRAGVSAMSVDGNCAHVVLESAPEQDRTAASWTDSLPSEDAEALLTLSGEDLLRELAELRRFAEQSPAEAIGDTARRWLQHRPRRCGATLALVAQNLHQLRGLLDQAETAVRAKQPLNSDRLFYEPHPLAQTGQVALVFPGAGNQFIGMGREAAARWPEVARRLDRENHRLASQFAGGRFWTANSLESLTHRDVIFGQVWLGTLMSDLLAAFHVRPQAVIGYSLGETTGLFATRTWTARDEMLARMERSTLFTNDLAGRCDAARQAWNLPPEETVQWQVGVVDRPADVVRRALVGRERVYLLIVNTPQECVIGGDRAAVESLVRTLGCLFHPVQGVTTVHCPVARSVEAAYRQLHLLETRPPEGVRFYSGAWGRSYAVTRESAADSIVRQAVEAFDFTQVIRAAYADGVRLFVEAGPGSSCSRMIDQILHGRPHLARSACVPGQEGVGTLLRLLGHLVAHGVAVDLEKLYPAEPAGQASKAAAHAITVRIGQEAFRVPSVLRRQNLPSPVLAQEVAANAAVGTLPPAPLEPLMMQMAVTQIKHAQAQETFLRLAQQHTQAVAEVLSFHMAMLTGAGAAVAELPATTLPATETPTSELSVRPVALDRSMCMEFATGSIARILGPAFAPVDTYPTRVRLPDEPLMLVDRIVSVSGEPGSMTSGRVVTEHDVRSDAWYLDGGRIPTCIAVEAGQADLFLSGYLGIDFVTRGQAVYRLLDAVVSFHGPLPAPEKTIVYDIAIEHFFRQGQTHLFRFHFDATVDGQPFLTMRNGCAGFFSAAELAAGKGIVQTAIDQRPLPGKRPGDWVDLTPMTVETYRDDQVAALRRGDLAACFGPAFEHLGLKRPMGLPSGRMTLVHRILKLDPAAGRYGLGQIVGEADIHPEDWFLTCHFVDDRVMPGTLMYECCLHTLRIYLLRMGWVGEADAVACEPVPEVSSQLKCRGQVTAATRKVQYEVTLKEIGYAGDGTPFAIADALMYADGKPIVQITNMSVRLSGLTRRQVEDLWRQRGSGGGEKRPAIFDTDRITAFALGKPSEAFGEKYRIFDHQRKIARLPGPPFQFLDRITSIRDCRAWELAAGGVIEAQYDVPPDAWYFRANQQTPRSEMPFAVLLEIALQPCGWLAAYLGSALVSEVDLSFRNLGGNAVQLLPVVPEIGTLTTTVKITGVSHSGGMIIQHFDMVVRCARGDVYRGNTYFGFFSKQALANQVGIRDAVLYHPGTTDAEAFVYPETPPFPDRTMRMVDEIDYFDPAGGPKRLGFIRGRTRVDPDAWFFKAHFFEDPVWPGSLGLESFLQLLKVVAYRRWGKSSDVRFETLARGQKHAWVYRGQIIPRDRQVGIEAVVTEIDDARKLIRADGFLSVDGRVIYQMNHFAITMTAFS